MGSKDLDEYEMEQRMLHANPEYHGQLLHAQILQLRNIQETLNSCVIALAAIVLLLVIALWGSDLREFGDAVWSWLIKYSKLLKH